MARISREKIDELIQTADIVDVVGEFVSLQPSGKSMKGLCPFHSEKTPSFFVNQEKQIFNCFGCHKKGNVISFVEEYKHLDFIEAVEYLADKYHFDLGHDDAYQVDQYNFKKIYNVNKLAKDFYNLNLLNLDTGQKALAYLESRKLDKQTLSEFNIGYAPARGNLLLKNLKENFQEFELVEAGLIASGDSGDYYDIFRDRIVFPILNEQGKVLGFSGRILTDDKNQAKYVNTHTTRIFNKGQVLYNLDKALPFITQRHRLVLMEGFFDVIQASKAGVEESVCTMGTELTLDQVKKIKKYADQVVICYDGDKAGQQATYRALQMLEKMQVEVQVAMMPDGLDPDEYIKKNSPAKFRNQLKQNLVDKYDFVYHMIVGKGLESSSEIENAKAGLFKFLLSSASSTITSIYLKKFSDDIKIDYSIIDKDYQKFLVNQRRYQDVAKATQQPKQSFDISKGIRLAEVTMINYYLQSDDYRELIEDAFKDNSMSFGKGPRHEIMVAMRELYASNHRIDLSMVKADITSDLFSQLEDLLLNDHYHYSVSELLQLIDSILLGRLDQEVQNLSQEIIDLYRVVSKKSGTLEAKEASNQINVLHKEIQEKKRAKAKVVDRRKNKKPSV